MKRYRNQFPSAYSGALHLLDADTALGKNPHFACPTAIPPDIQAQLVLLHLAYFSFDGEVHIGQVVVHREIARPIRQIFGELLRRRFPIASMVPIAAFGWDDTRSMQANNTSAFNYRYKDKPGPPELSEHAFGLAIDLNPWFNPCIREGVATPSGAHYDPERPGTIVKDSWVVKLFQSEGADWGGSWESLFDPQHFEFSLS